MCVGQNSEQSSSGFLTRVQSRSQLGLGSPLKPGVGKDLLASPVSGCWADAVPHRLWDGAPQFPNGGLLATGSPQLLIMWVFPMCKSRRQKRECASKTDVTILLKPNRTRDIPTPVPYSVS